MSLRTRQLESIGEFVIMAVPLIGLAVMLIAVVYFMVVAGLPIWMWGTMMVCFGLLDMLICIVIRVLWQVLRWELRET
ncbi:MAG TPA: hypothetical protein VFJ01_05570 [Oleiagrimonas sp.]|nr:hypothetical protein [Oleiagrimonas sp.]